jgi:hypothetical protein
MKTAVAAGIVLGLLYTLSPLTVLSLAAVVAIALLLSRRMSPRERAWWFGVVGLALALRLAVVALLFLLADPSRPFGAFFGDEELFKSRTVWLRNAFLGVPISPADMIYVFDEVGQSQYLYLLAYIQALVGDAPYGMNVLNASWYIAGVMLLHWQLRRAYGALVALGAAIMLLFLPTLFSWSISVLKEPLYILLAMIELALATQILRGRTIATRVAGAAGVLLCAYLLEGVRTGGWLLAVAGTTAGIAAAVIIPRPRLVVASVVALPIVAAIAWAQPPIRQRVVTMVQEGAFQHWGHVVTQGYSYRLLDEHIYELRDRRAVFRMTDGEMGRFAVRAAVNFLTVPRPSQIESRAALAYLPEQAVWYVILLLLPVGAVAGFRRDPVMTSLLVSHGLAAAAMVALTGGNIGTLIRHRGLTLPYFSGLALVGAVHVIAWSVRRRPVTASSAIPTGEHA